MSSYKAIIQYRGTHFHGFQIQAQERSIQGELLRVLKTIQPNTHPRILASGRTDAGVHALGQVLRIDLERKIAPLDLQKSINALVDKDIAIISLEDCSENFHPIKDAIKKEYRYYFAHARSLGPWERFHVTRIGYDVDWKLMKEACNLFLGVHDFQNYFCLGTPVKSTVREIFECEIRDYLPQGELEQLSHQGRVYVFRVVGNGFLKQMVRLMVSVVWSVGKGVVSLEQLEKSLNSPQGQHLAAVAPPQGLFLHEVHY